MVRFACILSVSSLQSQSCGFCCLACIVRVFFSPFSLLTPLLSNPCASTFCRHPTFLYVILSPLLYVIVSPLFSLPPSGRAVSLVLESDRKLLREIMKGSSGQVGSRHIPPQVVSKYKQKIAELEQDVRAVFKKVCMCVCVLRACCQAHVCLRCWCEVCEVLATFELNARRGK